MRVGAAGAEPIWGISLKKTAVLPTDCRGGMSLNRTRNTLLGRGNPAPTIVLWSTNCRLHPDSGKPHETYP